MAWQQQRTIPSGQACKVCGVRYQQGHGLCRQCEKDTRALEQLEAVASSEQARAAELMARSLMLPRVRAEYFDDGVWFVVTWDGTDSGPAACGIPPAHLRGEPSYGRRQGQGSR